MTAISAKVRTMINWWHLLWVAPLAAIIGVAVEAILITGDDDK